MWIRVCLEHHVPTAITMHRWTVIKKLRIEISQLINISHQTNFTTDHVVLLRYVVLVGGRVTFAEQTVGLCQVLALDMLVWDLTLTSRQWIDHCRKSNSASNTHEKRRH